MPKKPVKTPSMQTRSTKTIEKPPAKKSEALASVIELPSPPSVVSRDSFFANYKPSSDLSVQFDRVDRTYYYRSLALQKVERSIEGPASYEIALGNIVLMWNHGNIPYVVVGITTNEGNVTRAKLSLKEMKGLEEELPQPPDGCLKKQYPASTLTLMYHSVWYICKAKHPSVDPAELPDAKRKSIKNKKAKYNLEKKEEKILALDDDALDAMAIELAEEVLPKETKPVISLNRSRALTRTSQRSSQPSIGTVAHQTLTAMQASVGNQFANVVQQVSSDATTSVRSITESNKDILATMEKRQAESFESLRQTTKDLLEAQKAQTEKFLEQQSAVMERLLSIVEDSSKQNKAYR